jgi:MFS family permease
VVRLLLRGLPVVGRASVSAMVAVLVVRLVDENLWFLPAGTMESFRSELGLTYGQAGVVLAAAGPGTLAALPLTASLDHRSRRVVAAGGAFGMALSLAAFAAAGSFAVLVAAGFVMGAAATAMVDAAEVALVDLVPPDHLRSFLARTNLLAAAGDLLGPLLVSGVFFVGWSWRAAFWIGAVAVALYGLVLARTPLPGPPSVRADAAADQDAPADEPASTGPTPPWLVLRAVLADRRVWAVGAVSLLLDPFDEPFLGFTVALLQQERGASAGAAGLVAMVTVAGGLFAFAMAEPRLRRVRDDRMLQSAALAMAVGSLLVVLGSVVVVALAGFLVAAGLNLTWLAVQHRSLTLRPGEAGTTRAVLSAIEFNSFLVPIAFGVLADRVSLVAVMVAYVGLAGVVALLSRVLDGSGQRQDAADIDGQAVGHDG